MNFQELTPGVNLLTFPDYWSMRKVKDLCIKKHRSVLYAWERKAIKEYQAVHWVLQVVPGRWKNYAEEYTANPCMKALDSLGTAIEVLDRQNGWRSTHQLIARSF
jgi:hypothetical protein